MSSCNSTVKNTLDLIYGNVFILVTGNDLVKIIKSRNLTRGDVGGGSPQNNMK